MLDYSKPFHIVEDDNGDYCPKVSFDSLEEAMEFIKFAPAPNLIVISSEELEDFLDYK